MVLLGLFLALVGFKKGNSIVSNKEGRKKAVKNKKKMVEKGKKGWGEERPISSLDRNIERAVGGQEKGRKGQGKGEARKRDEGSAEKMKDIEAAHRRAFA